MTGADNPSERLEMLARTLFDAQERRIPVPPLSEVDASLTVSDAYAIQHLNIGRRIEGGRRRVGRKIGLTSRAMQQALGVYEPDFGVLLDDMFVEDWDAVPSTELIQPRIEAEISLVMGKDLAGPGVNAVGALRAIDSACASLEIIDSRIVDWRIALTDTIADNASSGRCVVSAKPMLMTDLNLPLIGMAIAINGTVVDTGAGAAALGNPIRCVAWLANKLAEFGERLHAGEIILAGALHRAVPVKAGDVVVAEFDRLGAVHTRFI